MRKIVLSLFIALQAIYFVSLVCGSNLTSAKSMSCCQNGHMGHMRMHDSKSRTCCSHCDLGKKSIAKPQKGIQRDLRIAQTSDAIVSNLDFRSISGSELPDNPGWHPQTFVGPSPPNFILREQLLI